MQLDEFDTNSALPVPEFQKNEGFEGYGYGGGKRLLFRKEGGDLILVYMPDDGVDFIDEAFKRNSDNDFVFTVKRLFDFRREDVLDLNSEDKRTRSFRFGHIDNNNDDYYRVNAGVLGINNGLLLYKEMDINPEWFAPIISYKYGVISIFDKIDKLVKEDIIIGGPHVRAIPVETWQSILHKFPNETELRHYYNSRVQHLLEEYFATMTDSEAKLQRFLERKEQTTAKINGSDSRHQSKVISEYEVKKYEFLYERLRELLKDDLVSEKAWEREILKLILLIYPRYVCVIEQMEIKEFLTDPNGKNRYPDLVLIDTDGHIDLIEIKKPSASSIFRSGLDHDNAIPSLSLTKTVMQMEKYILYFQKGGYALERQLNQKYERQLPDGLKLRIVNPKGILILGRKDFDASYDTDFEVIRRKYANVVDILTYDDLLLRVKHIIDSVKKRA